MTPLKKYLLSRITTEGPISISDYMSECLLHPEHGYYTNRAPFGAGGDFTTAPEISQMFGELIGLSLAQSWLDHGAPGSFTLAELGPGRGMAMADILRATRNVPGFHSAMNIVLVEASPALVTQQRDTLAGYEVAFAKTAADLPQAPLFLLANEFFDALPIRQFQREGKGWRERQVGIENGDLVLGLSPIAPVPALGNRLEDTKDGDVVEICPALPTISAEIGQRIQDFGGSALILDYGDWRSLGDTLQAMRAHAAANPFEDPGMADLTAHVDFEALALATPSAYSRVTTQGVFLERLGITSRAQTLAESLSGKPLNELIAAHRRLTHPEEMGTLFKVIGFYQSGTTPPPGLDP